MDKKGESSHTFFLDRLSEAAERHVGVNKDDRGFKMALAKALSTRASTVQRWFHKSYPEAKHLVKIFETFGATPNFLLGIESKSKPERFPVPILELANFVQIKNPIRREDFITIPLVNGSIAAGRTIVVDENIEDWIIIHKNITPKTKNLVAIHVDKKEGMSMYPILKPNDIVIIDRDDITINPRSIYAIRIDDGCTIKRVQQSDETLLLIPENTGYKTQVIDLKAHPRPIVGRVIWCSKAL